MLVSGITSWYFIEPLLLKPVQILISYASQLPAPDWIFSHSWKLTIARHTVLNGQQLCGEEAGDPGSPQEVALEGDGTAEYRIKSGLLRVRKIRKCAGK